MPDQDATLYNFPKLHFAQGAAAATPDAGELVVYADVADGHLKQKDSTGTVTDLAAAGGSGPAALVPLDAAPTSAHAQDDEFSGSALDAKWTNPGTAAAGQGNSVAVGSGWLKLEPATAGSADTGKRVFFIRQAAPAGNFTIMAKIADGRAGDDARVGIFVAKTAGKAYVLGSQRQNGRIANFDGVTTYSETADWSGYDGVLDLWTSPAWPGPIWLKLVFAGGTLTAYYSASGVSWTLLGSQASVTQPDRIGLCLWANTPGILADHELGVDWFRVTEP